MALATKTKKEQAWKSLATMPSDLHRLAKSLNEKIVLGVDVLKEHGYGVSVVYIHSFGQFSVDTAKNSPEGLSAHRRKLTQHSPIVEKLHT